VLALTTAPGGFTVADLATRVHTITGNTDYTARHATYDLRKLRGKELITKPSRSHRYQIPAPAARTITALLALRDHVIAPLLAGIRNPRIGHKPIHWTHIDHHYETLRINMQTPFHHPGITTTGTMAQTTFPRSGSRKRLGVGGEVQIWIPTCFPPTSWQSSRG
jgi:DNA-binding transcriptional ArsR family regulator